MIRIIAIDDELPALKRIGKLLQTFDHVQVAGLFDNAQAFLEHALTDIEPIDLVLLDMEMPGVHGLELARRLRTFRPEAQVAFLTAYSEFARDAFDVEALDYLLKPAAEEDIARLLGRFAKRSGRAEAVEIPLRQGIAVRSFGPFTVTTEQGEQVRFRNSKGRELLAYLHHHGGKAVSKAQIMDDLWYGRDLERTQANLHSTVYQLRKDLETFGLHGIVEQTKSTSSYNLNWPVVACDDVAVFKEQYRQFRQTSSLTHLIQAIQLYGDGYLSGSGYGWVAPRQAELEIVYAELLEAMVDIYVRQQRYEIALSPMQKWARLLPLDERLHAKMVALLLLMNRRDDAFSYYELALDLIDTTERTSVLDFSSLSANPYSMF